MVSNVKNGLVISGSWFDEFRKRVISRSKVIPNMVLMIKEGGSFLAIEEEEFHLQWSWLMKIDGSFLIVLIIEEGWSFLIWSLRGIFLYNWRKRINSRRKVIPNMVLIIEGRRRVISSNALIFEEAEFQFYGLGLWRLMILSCMVYIIEEEWFFLIWSWRWLLLVLSWLLKWYSYGLANWWMM